MSESEDERNLATMITSQDIIDLIAGSGIEVDTATLCDDLDLFGQGLDSLDVVNLELRIERRYGIEFGPDRSLKLLTIRALVDHLNAELGNVDADGAAAVRGGTS
ncbi:acyl carrier protein [Mycolicibacterium sp. HK-90]|uniref:acyl carrier protein n=1 Tax=Mycolicibacterium sp. HK-90 TaxID=3056937 RepID=UPI002658DF22|nr:phosphopantetheine-binding protein [Mycolicibacterium sp. HK-90]WKG02809.1 phosphopantetheine-binding protein [Mycolicibacterium sp. HK-90]